MPEIASVQLKVGLEIHVELATRTKMFSRVPNPASPEFDRAAPNTLIDPVVLGLPGALPVMNRAAVEMSMLVGTALGCTIAAQSKWDRKSYFYPDLPKNYQISQYQLPLCFDGSVELPVIGSDGKIDWDRTAAEERPHKRIGIIRAHLEEDAGKLLHEAPGGGRIEGSLADWNRAGTPLLEIVTQPDFTSADEVVVFAQMLRNICRFLGASEGVMQKGHMRFEPNINCILTLTDGRTVATPVVEVKNLNSFKSVKGAIEHELREQPRRWMADGQVHGPGAKSTRGWDETSGAGGETFLQRSKEDAHDYRYFPDPDLVPVVVDEAWREAIRGRVPELPLARMRRFIREFGLSPKEAAAITDERDVCRLYEETVAAAMGLGMESTGAARKAANMILQSGAKRANERSAAAARAAAEAAAGAAPSAEPVLVSELGITARQIAGIMKLREDGAIGSNAADELFGLLCAPWESEPTGADPAEVSRRRGMVIVRDEGALVRWCEQAISENAKSAEDVRAGKVQALGRLVGAAMKHSGGQGDAQAIRAKLAEMLGAKA